MKKSVLLFVCGLGLLTACKKDRVCECTEDFGTPLRTEYKKVTKKWMINEAKCVSYTETYNSNNQIYSTVVNCEIK